MLFYQYIKYMYEILLHVGIEHPNLLWVLVPSLLAFAAGVGVGMYTESNRTEAEAEAANTVND